MIKLSSDATGRRQTALAILFVMPLFFSSNIILGRAAVSDVGPFTLAFIRWGTVALVLLPFVCSALWRHRARLRANAPSILLAGFLGMWVCGALVYVALLDTSATNGTLIYTSSPVLVILMERVLRGRQIAVREAIGIALAFLGVVTIVCRGSIDNLVKLSFNQGDLLFVAAALAWAIYSVLLKSRWLEPLQTLPLFMVLAAGGAALLAPFAVYEMTNMDALPSSAYSWALVAGIIIFASLIAFTAFQHGVRVVGASTTSVFLYLLPVYGVGMAVIFLGETFEVFHAVGIATVLGGVILATAPIGRSQPNS